MTVAPLRNLLALAALAMLLPAGLTAQQFPPASAVGPMVRYLVEDGEAGAVVLGLLEEDGSTTVVYHGRRAGGEPIGADARFGIGEVTMTLTATLLAEMAARGEVSLDDPVSSYLPAEVELPTERGQAITLGHLVRHRSGLPAGPEHPGETFTVEDLYAAVSGARLEFVPGQGRELSRLGYGLLGLALSRAADRPFAELLAERVLGPVGMASTGYAAGPGPVVRGRAGGEPLEPVEVTEAMQGATGLWSTAPDLLRFLAANAGEAETALERAMKAAQEVDRPDPEGEGYGYSWRTYTTAGQQLLLTHGGRTRGSTALLSLDPASGAGTVMLTNQRGFDDWISRDLLYPDVPARMGSVVDVDRAELEGYVGTYESGQGRYRATVDGPQYHIRLEDEGYLTYQPSGKVRTPLFPVSDSVFTMLRTPLTVTFTRHDRGVRMRVHVNEREQQSRGGSWTAWKVDEDSPSPVVVAGNAGVGSGWGTGTWVLLGLLGVGLVVAVLRPVLNR